LRIRLNSEADLRETFARLAVARGTFLLSCERETLSVEDLFLWLVQGYRKTPAIWQPVGLPSVSPPVRAPSPPVRAIQEMPSKGPSLVPGLMSAAPENPITPLPAAIAPAAPAGESWFRNGQAGAGGPGSCLEVQRLWRSRLDGGCRRGGIGRDGSVEMGRPGFARIAE